MRNGFHLSAGLSLGQFVRLGALSGIEKWGWYSSTLYKYHGWGNGLRYRFWTWAKDRFSANLLYCTVTESEQSGIVLDIL